MHVRGGAASRDEKDMRPCLRRGDGASISRRPCEAGAHVCRLRRCGRLITEVTVSQADTKKPARSCEHAGLYLTT
ncbi:hypothetical protein GCM10022253_28400 [Sphingomonas endophytica]